MELGLARHRLVCVTLGHGRLRPSWDSRGVGLRDLSPHAAMLNGGVWLPLRGVRVCSSHAARLDDRSWPALGGACLFACRVPAARGGAKQWSVACLFARCAQSG